MRRVWVVSIAVALLGCAQVKAVLTQTPIEDGDSLVAPVAAEPLRGPPPAPLYAVPQAPPANPFRSPPVSAIPVGTPVYPLTPMVPGTPGAAWRYGSASSDPSVAGDNPRWYEPDAAGQQSASAGEPAVPIARPTRRGRPTSLRPDAGDAD